MSASFAESDSSPCEAVHRFAIYLLVKALKVKSNPHENDRSVIKDTLCS